jgi:hypothetical protein
MERERENSVDWFITKQIVINVESCLEENRLTGAPFSVPFAHFYSLPIVFLKCLDASTLLRSPHSLLLLLLLWLFSETHLSAHCAA